MSAPTAPSAAVYAERAARAHAAMQRHFWTRRGIYRRDGLPRPPRAAAHLWPFIRALVATLDLTGIPAPLRPPTTGDDALAAALQALERYWEPQGAAPAYASDVVGARWGGDRYHDDNAWVGLALVQLERMRPGAGRLSRAAQLFAFAQSGWDRRTDVPSPGGVFWVEQGRGVGARNHDRNTVSTAPNAQLGLHLAELGLKPPGPVAPAEMEAWVRGALTADNGLFWDKIRGDGSIDRAQWSYNQGSMIGLNLLLHRAAPGDGTEHLERAEAVATTALRHYGGVPRGQPAAFNAIFARNLLQLHAATGRAQLRADIRAALSAYADWAWTDRRGRRDLFRLSGRTPTLLDQSAIVSVLALLAWDPSAYGELA